MSVREDRRQSRAKERSQGYLSIVSVVSSCRWWRMTESKRGWREERVLLSGSSKRSSFLELHTARGLSLAQAHRRYNYYDYRFLVIIIAALYWPICHNINYYCCYGPRGTFLTLVTSVCHLRLQHQTALASSCLLHRNTIAKRTRDVCRLMIYCLHECTTNDCA
ncbi:hypothetical protein BJX63DRAFT_116657 [Aspergillus granulosus]|uniref:Uncharacterized protein n=1 Tax=Aspergillus granulosus TaxID=176169 RepID=A0ABR4HNN3_9EURO